MVGAFAPRSREGNPGRRDNIASHQNTTTFNEGDWDRSNPLPAYLTGKNYSLLSLAQREKKIAFDSRCLDADAVRVVERLVKNGHTAYFVGGCVRDLLLGRKPKDFDIATTARPRQVKKLFRNCWIIGRRFKLAHVNFGTKTVEVSTFRAFLPETFDTDREDLLIRRDNLFGTPEQDACRRDFTINGLFYDLGRGVIIDNVAGLQDIEDRIIRTVGDPEVRLPEDPVRILRAIKFASRIDFKIEPATYEAMVRFAPDISRCAAPRVLEEILRILRGGAARQAFQYFWDTDVLQVLLPEVDDRLRTEPDLLPRYHVLLENLDHMVARGLRPSPALCLASLFLPVAEGPEIISGKPHKAWEQASAGLNAMMESFCPRLNVPRRDAGRLRDIIALQKRLRPSSSRRRYTRASLTRHPSFGDALEIFRAYCQAFGDWGEELERWDEAWATHKSTADSADGKEDKKNQRRGSSGGQKKRGSRNRRRRRGPKASSTPKNT